MNDAKSEAASIFEPLWRRKWLILALAIVVGAATYAYYKRQTPVYQAHTSLYLGGANEQQATLGSSSRPPLTTRAVLDQVELINTTISEEVHRRAREQNRLAVARAKGKASANANSDFITIVTEAHRPKVAVALANELAAAYTRTQRAQYVRNIKAQIANANQQLRRVETPAPAPGTKGKAAAPSASATIQAAQLESRIAQLETELSTFSGVQQVGKARATPLPLSPTPKKNAIFGFVIGLIAGCVLAYLLARFDRRLRRFGSVEEVLRAPVLAALPTVRSPTLRPGGERAPAPALVEPLRGLNTALKLSHTAPGREGGPRLLLFISPDPGDGRSTLVANLARVQRDAGERVMVIEADFRRPALARLMGLSAARGLPDVLTGLASPHAALQNVQASSGDARPVAVGDHGGGVATAVGQRTEGVLSVLQSGGPIPNPPAMLGSEAMAWLLRTMADEYDSVLIDAPCPLEFSDALPLFPLVDGMVVVSRLGHTRLTSAERLAQLVERTVSAPTLGAVVNGVARRDIERSGFYVPAEPGGRRHLIGR